MYKRQVYCNPASHGEGRFVAPKEWLDKLFENGQVATQYCDPEGDISDVYKRQVFTHIALKTTSSGIIIRNFDSM